MSNEIINPINTGSFITGVVSNTSHKAMLIQIALLQEQMRNYVLADSFDLSLYALKTELDGKVDDDQVLTDVPADAIFTDTLTTINGKTGIIAKADIVALGIPAQDTKYTLPVATESILGGVKSSSNISIDANGVMSIVDDSHNHVVSNIDGLQTVLDSKASTTALTTQASAAVSTAKDYTDTAINNLISAAPGALDTLNELATALGNDPNFATTMANILATKPSKFVTTVGNTTDKSFIITHNLNSQDLVFSIRETGAPYAMVQTDVEFTSANTAIVKFAVAPTVNEYTVTFIG